MIIEGQNTFDFRDLLLEEINQISLYGRIKQILLNIDLIKIDEMEQSVLMVFSNREGFSTKQIFKEKKFYELMNCLLKKFLESDNYSQAILFLEKMKNVNWNGNDYSQINIDEKKLLEILSF